MRKGRLLAIALLALTAGACVDGLFRSVESTRKLNLAVIVPGGVIPPAQRSLRPVYPYSVIPGGAYSAAELRYSVAKDSVVREHYADFDFRSARLVTLASDRFQYVSYRIKNKVFWTHGKVHIPKGEVLVTDGVHFARTRCGNRLSDARREQTAPTEPAAKVLSLPPFSMQLVAQNKVSLPPAPPIAEAPDPGLTVELPVPYLQPAPSMPGNISANWPPLGVLPSPAPSAAGDPSIPALPSAPQTPVLPQFSTPFDPGFASPLTITAEVPEPASLYLFIFTFAVSLWFILRWMRTAP